MMGDDDMSAMPAANHTMGNSMLRRMMAGMEALILAGIIYLVNADQQRKEDMIILKTTSAITAQSVSGIPEMNVRLVKAEGDIIEIKRRISNNEVNIEDLRNKARLR